MKILCIKLEINQRLKSTVFCSSSSIIEMITLRTTQEVRKHVTNWNKETLSLEIPLFFPRITYLRLWGKWSACENAWHEECKFGNYVYFSIWKRLSLCIDLRTLIRLCIMCRLTQPLENRATSRTLSQIHLAQEHILCKRMTYMVQFWNPILTLTVKLPL
jgi:hypothetical protein